MSCFTSVPNIELTEPNNLKEKSVSNKRDKSLFYVDDGRRGIKIFCHVGMIFISVFKTVAFVM